jgi:hypothetical protein
VPLTIASSISFRLRPPQQDEAIIAELNQGANRGRFNLFFHNCADFARDVINHYYPKVIRRNFVADLGMTTPKQVAKSLVHFSRKNQELKFSAYALEQVPGNRPQSRRCAASQSRSSGSSRSSVEREGACRIPTDGWSRTRRRCPSVA